MMDMWKAWAASSSDSEGRRYCHSFYAPTYEDALHIVAKMGWELDGQIVDEAVTDAEVAVLERLVNGYSLH